MYDVAPAAQEVVVTGLCGWIIPPGHADSAILDAMAAALPVGTPETETRTAGMASLAAPRGATAGEDAVVAAIVGAPRWSDARYAETARVSGDAAALLAAWRRVGRDLLQHLEGHFCLAVLDGRDGEGLIATDRAGTYPLAYGEVEGGLAFASSVQAVRRFPGIDDDVPLQAVLAYLFYYVLPSPMSIYCGVAKLLPGQAAHFRSGGMAVHNYAPIVYAEAAEKSFAEYSESLHALLRQAMGRTLAGASSAKTGAYLSGGLDSSTVAGLFSEAAGESVNTFTIGFDEEGYDESGYARLVADWFSTTHHEYRVTPDDVASLIPRIAAAYDEPFGNHSAVPAYYCARLAHEAGMKLMLAGDGGDELFAGNERYIQVSRFDSYTRLPRWLRKKVINPFVNLPGMGSLPFMGRVRRMIDYVETPLPDRLHAFDFFARVPLDEVFTPEQMKHVDLDTVYELTRATFDAPARGGPVQRMMHMDLSITLADNDLRKVRRMAALAGVDVRFPMLDDELMRFAASIPESELLAGDELRGFYKKAMRGLLPPAVLKKPKHGFGLPFARWIKTDPTLKEMVDAALTDFAKRDVVKAEFVDRVKESHRRPEPTLLDRFAWDIMMLEEWWRVQHEGAAEHFCQARGAKSH